MVEKVATLAFKLVSAVMRFTDCSYFMCERCRLLLILLILNNFLIKLILSFFYSFVCLLLISIKFKVLISVVFFETILVLFYYFKLVYLNFIKFLGDSHTH